MDKLNATSLCTLQTLATLMDRSPTCLQHQPLHSFGIAFRIETD